MRTNRIYLVIILIIISLSILPFVSLVSQPVYDGVTFTTTQEIAGHELDGIIFRNCVFQNIPNDRAIKITGISNGLIENCIFYDIGATCIYIVMDSPGWTIRNSTFDTIVRHGILTDEGATNLTVEYNIFRDNALLTTGDKMHAIYIQAPGFLVQYNRITDVHYANGVSIRTTGIVKGNIIDRCGIAGTTSAACIKYFPDHPAGPQSLIIENNFCWDPANHVIYIDDQAGGTGNQADSTIVRFNTAIKRPVSYENGYEAPVGITIDPGMDGEYVEVYGNLIVNTANANDYSDNPPYSDLAVDNLLFLQNPDFFEDWSNNDFHITNDPQVVDAATNVPAVPQLDVDLESRPNGSNADISADEYYTGYTNTCTLTLNTSGSGSVTVDPPGGTYSKETVVTLTAYPDPNYVFDGWTGDLNGLADPVTITMICDKNVTATFVYYGGSPDAVVDSDIPVAGTVTGSYIDTQVSDDVYEVIEEIETGGKPTSRTTYLEHKWTMYVMGGNTITFYVEAYHSANSEGDDFIFAYSTNGYNFIDMLTVTKTSDDNNYQSYTLPSYVSGTVTIRVKDADQSPGNRVLDKIFIDHMYIHSDGGVVTPPADPSNLVATAVSSSRIDLTWTDNSNNELGFKIERSDDGGQNFSEIDQVGANDTTYSNTGLSPSTQYCYQVRAYNSAGNSGYSNVDCATTQEGGGPVDDTANSDIPVAGTVTGSYTDTQTSNDVYESIEEIESGGKPSNRYSYLEHKWTINVTGGTSVTFYVEAYKTASTDGDDFVFAYSTNDVDYTDMVTVTKTSDDNTPQTYVMSASLSGTVYIRVKDTDQTQGNRSLDKIFVDHLFIRSEGIAKQSDQEETGSVALPSELRLHRNYPNPFNPSTTIRYSLPVSVHVNLSVYNMMGRTVVVLVDGVQSAGVYTKVWEAVDSKNNALPSGVYLCRLQVGSNVQTMKMMYMR